MATQLDMYDVEDVGLVKFDFLGLRTLTVINNAVKSVEKLIHILSSNQFRLMTLKSLIF